MLTQTRGKEEEEDDDDEEEEEEEVRGGDLTSVECSFSVTPSCRRAEEEEKEEEREANSTSVECSFSVPPCRAPAASWTFVCWRMP